MSDEAPAVDVLRGASQTTPVNAEFAGTSVPEAESAAEPHSTSGTQDAPVPTSSPQPQSPDLRGDTVGEETGEERTLFDVAEAWEAVSASVVVSSTAGTAESGVQSELHGPDVERDSREGDGVECTGDAAAISAATGTSVTSASSPAAVAGASEMLPAHAAVANDDVPVCEAEGDEARYRSMSAGSWPEATVVTTQKAEPAVAWNFDQRQGSSSSGGAASTVPASGTGARSLKELMLQLSGQLEMEKRRCVDEQSELAASEAEERGLREELAALQRSREVATAATNAAEQAVRETLRQHTELSELHETITEEAAAQEAKSKELRLAAQGSRDWARDGPEKDALVETNLQIAEAHDRLAESHLQQRMNRDGLRKQLDTLQQENRRLRGETLTRAS
uniref:Uncharacterized protein n=1 Tax=Noctiluca scintillans TaxID=2966 RepID=A0A7S1F6N4_NOCSC